MNEDAVRDPLAEAADLVAETALGNAGQGLETTVVHTWPWPDGVAVLLMLVAGGIVTWCYLRERGAGRWLKSALLGLRLGLVALVLIMMYGWMQHRYRTDLPDLVILLDDSDSMNLEDHYATESLRERLRQQVAAVGLEGLTRANLAKSWLLADRGRLLDELGRRYNLKLYLVGGTARPLPYPGDDRLETLANWSADQPASRLGQALRDVLQMQRGRPTAAIVLLSDGVTTEGKSLGEVAEHARRKAIPLYVIGLGSDQPPRDVRVSDLLVDEVAFVGDLVSLDFKLSASGYKDQQLLVQLKREGEPEVLAERRVRIEEDGTPQSVRLTYRPRKEGEYRFVVEAEVREDEVNAKNNRQVRRVQVRDETIRVLYVQEYPSFEFRFLKNLLGRGLKRAGEGDASGRSVSLTTVLQEADLEYAEQDEHAQRVFPVSRDELFQYDVLIFGDVNPSFFSSSVLENIAAFVTQRGGGMIVLSGPRHTPLAYRNTPLESLMPILLSTARQPPADVPLTTPISPQLTPLGISSPQLQLGDTVEQSVTVWRDLPGIYWMLEAPETRPAARVLVEHPTLSGNSGQNLPLILLQYVGAGKVVLHLTDESYRWSRDRRGETFYSRYWIQTLRYLSRAKLLGTERTAEMTANREVYRRGELVRLRVRFFDDRLAPADDDGVTVVIEQQEGRRRQVTLRREAAGRGIFEGVVVDLAEGSYRAWMATPTTEGQPPAQKFEVIAPPGEQTRLEMDVADLQLAARQSRGQYYPLEQSGQLADDLPRGRQVRIEPLPPTPIWNFWLFPLAFVVMIVSEWLLRKRAGML